MVLHPSRALAEIPVISGPLAAAPRPALIRGPMFGNSSDLGYAHRCLPDGDFSAPPPRRRRPCPTTTLARRNSTARIRHVWPILRNKKSADFLKNKTTSIASRTGGSGGIGGIIGLGATLKKSIKKGLYLEPGDNDVSCHGLRRGFTALRPSSRIDVWPIRNPAGKLGLVPPARCLQSNPIIAAKNSLFADAPHAR